MSAGSPIPPNGFPIKFEPVCAKKLFQNPPSLFEAIADDVPKWFELAEAKPLETLSTLVNFIFDQPGKAQDGIAKLVESVKRHLSTSDAKDFSFSAFIDTLFRSLCLPPELKEASQFFLADEYKHWSLLDQYQSASKIQAFSKKYNYFHGFTVSQFAKCFDLPEQETLGTFLWNLGKGWLQTQVSEFPVFQKSMSDLQERVITPLNDARDLSGRVLANYPQLDPLILLIQTHLKDPDKVANLCELLRTAYVLWDS